MAFSKSEDPNSAVAFDPESVLVGDVGLLLNPHFAKALYEELRRARGAEKARTALIQIGCLHGLRDAARAVGTTFHTPGSLATAPGAPALAVQLRGRPDFGSGRAIEICGSWPERVEATGRLSANGPAGAPACVVSAGYTSGWLSGILETDVVVVETRCSAAGDATCDFEARGLESWLESGDARGRAVAKALPMAELRRALAAIIPAPEDSDADSDPLVHIWGPVMIVPFASAEEALTAVDLLHSDPGLAEVSVIVIDVTEYAADEALEASALAPVVERIADAGAETVFAGVSPPLEAVIASLDPAPLLVCADLNAAIAASFQIAESQRRPA